MRIDRPQEGDDEPDSPARHPRREPDRPAPADEPVNRAEVFAEYQKAVDIEYRAYAIDRGYDGLRETEDKTTSPELRRIEAVDPERQLIGFKYRLKDKDRLTEKVIKLMDEYGRSPQEAFAMVKDAIRYTFQYPDDKYAKGVDADCERLKAAGFEPVDRQNSWGETQYKGINSRWRIPGTGQLFEVQFHTEASFAAKQETHPAYEKLRVGVPSMAEQRKLEQFQRDVTARVPIPRGAADIPNYP